MPPSRVSQQLLLSSALAFLPNIWGKAALCHISPRAHSGAVCVGQGGQLGVLASKHPLDLLLGNVSLWIRLPFWWQWEAVGFCWAAFWLATLPCVTDLCVCLPDPLARCPLPSFRGLILQDLTFVHLGNPDYIDSKVNFSKRWQQFNILDSMRCFQQV